MIDSLGTAVTDVLGHSVVTFSRRHIDLGRIAADLCCDHPIIVQRISS